MKIERVEVFGVAHEGRVGKAERHRWHHVVEHQLLGAGGAGLCGGLFGRGVVVDDVPHHMSQLLHLAALKVRLQQLEQLGLQGLVHQNVGALGGRHQRGAGDSVTADHDGAALVVKAVAHGWLDGCVVDAEGGYLEALVVQHHHLVALAHGR